MPKKNLKSIGIMSGTSLDGVDFVYAKFGQKSEYLDRASISFPKKLREKLYRCACHETTTDELAELHHELGRFYANSAKKVMQRKKWKADVFGLHGQTVYHSPKATLQIGEASYLSSAVGLPVISNFRSADMVKAGQGAPMAPFFHERLAQAKGLQNVAFQNLGGIANVTYLSRTKKLAFDNGPSNMLMDLALEKKTKGKISFDQDGRIAEKGVPRFDLVKKWAKAHPYFRKRPPKRCGREEFGLSFWREISADIRGLKLEDLISTLAEFTAYTIADSYKRFLPQMPKQVFLCGGGAKNNFLRFRIQYHLPETEVLTTEELGWPVDAIEGGAFAMMAVDRFVGQSSHRTWATGAKKKVLLGDITDLRG